MLWRFWSFVSGLPLGFALAFAALPSATPSALAWGAAAGGVGVLVAVLALARWRDDETDRGRHLAAAASTAWLALPAAGATWAGFAPGAWGWAGAALSATAVALLAGARAIGPARGPLGWGLRAIATAAVGAVVAVAAAAALAAARGAGVSAPSERWAAAVYDLDAGVATRPLPACSDEPRSVRVLPVRGAHPALSPDGALVWFDAPAEADGGRRQIHRLERASGEVRCWTCGEPGNNVRPSPGDSGHALVFETDRNATWRHPDDSDVQLTRARGQPTASRQLTYSKGPESHPRLGPGSQLVAWSQRSGGRYEVVAAALQGGHGGILLGEIGVLATGGAEWLVPLAWSPDARALLLGSGNPFAPLSGLLVDPATGRTTPIGDELAAASFDADGGWLALATARGGHWAGALPRALGFALAPWATARSRHGALLLGSAARSGATAEAPAAAAIALPDEIAIWGAPTGLALEPDGSGFVLGQRRDDARERLVEVVLDCPTSALASVRR